MTALVVFLLIGKEPPRPKTDSGTAKSSVLTTIGGLAQMPVFWLLGGGFFICGFTTAGVIKVHLIPYAVSCGSCRCRARRPMACCRCSV